MDRFVNVLLWAGLGCFAFAFVLSGVYPWLITDAKEQIASFEEVSRWVPPEFKDLKDRYPVAFAAAWPEAKDALTLKELAAAPADDPRRAATEAVWRRVFAKALREGRDTYVAEACWHCHSQYVRPVANEEARYGPVRSAADDNNMLQRPVLWGTRRIGPDLTYEGGRRSNDWHVAHFFDPRATTPDSVMPRFTWFLREGWEVRRTIKPDTAELEGLPDDTSYPYPGIYDTKAEAEQAMEAMRASMHPNLAEEAERLFVAEGRGPNATGLAVIAYLQWLGTWDGDERGGVRQ